MSFSQSLLLSQANYEMFAPSWQAGLSGSQNLSKSLRNYDLERVNIAKTCDKLCVALKENSKTNYASSQELEETDKQYVIRKDNGIPLRTFTNIWFGTLKIYQEQVNTLFRLSKDLLTRSCNYDIKHLAACKRKSSSKTHKILKKRRLTLNESTDQTYFSNTNYSKLLDDFGSITKEPILTSYKECSQTISHPVTHLQIREITIREINATTYSLADALDEDSGFGEATHEEITEFFNFVEDNSKFTVKKSANKRKSSFECESFVKQKRYLEDSPDEQIHNEIIPKTSLKRSITPTNIDKTSNQLVFSPANDLPQFNNEPPDNLDLNIKKETKFEPYTEYNSIKIEKHIKKKRHLIIDECTKIDNSLLLEEMNNKKISAKLLRKRILKAFKIKNSLTALELLTRFNRRSLKLSLFKKQKVIVSSQQFEFEYLNLLRDIFERNFNENLASQVYPKWKSFEESLGKKKRGKQMIKKQEHIVKQTEEVAALNNLNDYLNAYIINDNNNNVVMEEQGQQVINQDFNKNKVQLNICANHDWHPYGVMMTLLNLWRLNECNEISANKLFKLSANRIESALGFHSLLNLAKKHFVILTTFPGTIILQNVIKGKSAKIT